MIRPYRTLVLLTILTTSLVASGRTLEVPDTAASIASGLALASPGDTVVVAPGVYFETDLQMADGVTLLGDPANPGAVVIDGQWSGTLISCDGVAPGTLIGGITFRHGLGISEAPVHCTSGAPTFRRCHFRENMSGTDGGGVNVTDSQPIFEDCLFDTNQSGISAGGGLVSRRSNTLLRRCVFRNNLSLGWGGALYISGTTEVVVIEKCRFEDNVGRFGGALAVNGATASLLECDFDGNSGGDSGGAFIVHFGGRMFVEDSRFSGNASSAGKIGLIAAGCVGVLTCVDADHGLVIGAGSITWLDEGCDFVANEGFGWGDLKRLYR